MARVRRDHSDPAAHKIGDMMTSAMWIGLPASDGLPISTSTPTNPTASDSHSRDVGRSPIA
jgi:hypothetical protein